MAARLNRRHSELVLRRIKTSNLVERLQAHAMGKLTGPVYEDGKAVPGKSRPVEMSDSQVRATIFLIERTIAKAENPRDINVSGSVTLEQLITGAAAEVPDDADAASRTAH
jgi:hypothetical protein